MSQSGEKTEQPTERRLREARRKGQVTKSQDLTAALLLIGAIAMLWIASSYMLNGLREAMLNSVKGAAAFNGELNGEMALAAFREGVWALAWALAPLFAMLFIIALLVSYLQVGPVFAVESIKPNFNKLNPAQNFQQKFLKSRPYLELAKTLVKLTITVTVVGVVLWNVRGDVIKLAGQDVFRIALFALYLILRIGLIVGIAFLALAVGDYFLQKYLYWKEMKMTKQEVIREYKDDEGDPLIKSARRQMYREILMNNMMENVPQADAVLVNPTHIAVAIRYDQATMEAPTVVAKGAELIAAQIRRLAQESHVPVVHDVALARALYELEVGAEIPEELYNAVAAVLQWVYQLADERKEVTNHA